MNVDDVSFAARVSAVRIFAYRSPIWSNQRQKRAVSTGNDVASMQVTPGAKTASLFYSMYESTAESLRAKFEDKVTQSSKVGDIKQYGVN